MMKMNQTMKIPTTNQMMTRMQTTKVLMRVPTMIPIPTRCDLEEKIEKLSEMIIESPAIESLRSCTG